MTDPFPGFLLESWVIIDKRWKCVTDLRFIDDNSRLEKKTGKRIRHALEDIVELKQAVFTDLLTLHDEIFCSKKVFKALLGIAIQTVHFALADFDESCLLCKDAHIWCCTASFAPFGYLFRTLLAKIILFINIHIERVPATSINITASISI